MPVGAVGRRSRSASVAPGCLINSGRIANAADPDALLTRIGQFALVEGRVASVREAGATLYLNFGGRWTNGFAVTISRRIVGSFEAAAIGLKTLDGRRIRVRGWVERRGGPRIEVRDVGQLELPGGRLSIRPVGLAGSLANGILELGVCCGPLTQRSRASVCR